MAPIMKVVYRSHSFPFGSANSPPGTVLKCCSLLSCLFVCLFFCFFYKGASVTPPSPPSDVLLSGCPLYPRFASYCEYHISSYYIYYMAHIDSSFRVTDRRGHYHFLSILLLNYPYCHRTDLLTVHKEYVYDDGDESTGNDTFEREPYVVSFDSTTTGK